MNTLQSDILHTERLMLREMTPETYNRVMSKFTDSEIKKFFGIKSNEELELEKLRFKQGMTMSGKTFLYFHLVEKSSSQVLGWCGYHTWFKLHRRAEIGYVLNEDAYKRKGYMKEALPEVIRYGFEEMDLNRIEALVSPDNNPSLKLINNNGFTREGLLRENYMSKNKLDDSIIFSLLRREYIK
ncbi:MAG: GNAT family N-acetyltransferase [Bacteroidota bacterium]|nr:GNAT family N-acetyltransferase [Bacteroidota bacterium]